MFFCKTNLFSNSKTNNYEATFDWIMIYIYWYFPTRKNITATTSLHTEIYISNPRNRKDLGEQGSTETMLSWAKVKKRFPWA